MQRSCSANTPPALQTLHLPCKLRADSRTDLVAEEEEHPGLVSGVPGDVANELQHGRDPWNTAGCLLSLPDVHSP